MNRTLYSVLSYLLLPVMLARLWIKGFKNPDYRKRIGERLGFIPKLSGASIWLHCVSVGEFRAAIPLIDQLIQTYPKHQIMLTTTTPTGSAEVKKHYQKRLVHYYLPLDLSVFVKRFIKQSSPKLCIVMETEIWPNLIHCLKQNHIPTMLVNARLSERSLKKYQKHAAKLSQSTLNKLTLIATQNQNSLKRFAQLGVKTNKLVNAGNIKFDQSLVVDKQSFDAIKKIIGKRKALVFASTHKGEEEQILSTYLDFKDKLNNVLLIIVPRHPERFDSVYQMAKTKNIHITRRSDESIDPNAEVLLGDSMGEMMSYFKASDLVFMGGSLIDHGGHNMLEPASLGRPILFAQHVFNFAEIASELTQNNAAIQVKDTHTLFEQLLDLLSNTKRQKQLSDNAKAYFLSKQGAVDRLIKEAQSLL